MLALAGVQKYGPSPLTDDEIARVNGVSIQKSEWLRAIDAANSGRRSALDAAGQQRVLDTLINEELLLQMALNLGLEHGIPEVRGKLVQAAMDALANTGPTDPSPAELSAFAEANPRLFAQPEQRRVRISRHATQAAATDNRDGSALDIPDGPLNQRQLQRWAGNAVASAAFTATKAESPIAPIAVGQAWYRVEVLEIQPPRQPAAESLPQDMLLRAWQRQQSEQALARALQELRDGADVIVAAPAAP